MDTVKYMHSQILGETGVKHGWFMKYGGVSSGLFESLNGKKGVGDSDEDVDENRRRALSVLCHPEFISGSNKQQRQILKQVQGDGGLAHIVHEFKTNILEVTKSGEYQFFDASYTTKPDVVLSQTTADCASVIIADKNHKVVALVHGSWHTLKADLICDVVAKLKKQPGVGELIAGIGPMICKNCYEFGPEAKDLFDPEYLTLLPRHPGLVSGSQKEIKQIFKQVQNDRKQTGNYLVDLKQMVMDQLSSSGIEKINDLNICTLEDQRFFSHRRSGANSGRMITLASL